MMLKRMRGENKIDHLAIRLSRNKHMIQSYLQETQDEHIWNVFALSYNESAIFSRA